MKLPIIIIISVSIFSTGITATLYCDQQLNQLQMTTNNIKQKCTINNTTIKTCCDLDAFYFFAKPPGVYQMQCLCGGQWIIANAFCDTTTADGGWTVIQRRVDGSENFHRPWSDYEQGFGDLNKEFWYGLKSIHCLTQVGQWELRIDFEFKNKTRSYVHYDVFKVVSASEEYPLTVDNFTGITSTDPFAYHNSMKFSTFDNDNDEWFGNCAARAVKAKDNGGWWYNGCWTMDLNINYNPAQYGFIKLGGIYYNLNWTEMKIRPLKCIPQ